MQILQLGQTEIALLDAEGPSLVSEQDALDALGATYGSEAMLVAIPVSRFPPSFWQLATRQLGLFAQKFVNYSMRLAFVGDVSAQAAASTAFRDYMRECAAGGPVLFATDLDDLARQLGSGRR